MQPENRRTFIKKTTLAGFSALALPAGFSMANPAAKKLRVAVMGVNSRGTAHVQAFAAHPLAEVAYICDVDSNAIAKAIQVAKSAGQVSTPKGLTDFRKALEDKSVDILSIAAPDHWHTPAAILGLQAGKHVYVEKPGSHNPDECILLAEAGKKYSKIIQLGNQRRSWTRVREAMQRLHRGDIGKVNLARAWYSNARQSIGIGKQTAVPDWLDYELWQGPAPRKPYKDNLIHYNWHWHWNWGTGEMLNNGTHFVDLARWGLNVNFPSQVFSAGGRYYFQDDWETPDTQVATFRFPDDKMIQWEARSCNPRSINEMGSGVAFFGTNGTLELNDNSYKIYDASGKLIDQAESTTNTIMDQRGPAFDMDKDHFDNFIQAILNNKTQHSAYQECYPSVMLCHLANISFRSGKALNCDPQNGHIIQDAEAMKFWSRTYENGWKPVI